MTRAMQFATPIVICREAHYGRLADGREYLVRLGDRLPVDSEPVRKVPFYFVADGEPVTPYERPEVEHEPEPKRKAVKRYRVKEQRVINIGNTPEAMVFKVGDVFPIDSEPYRLLSRELRKQILEEVE